MVKKGKSNSKNPKRPHFNIKIITVTKIELKISVNGIITVCESARIRGFTGPYFFAFGLNTDPKNSEYGHFSRSGCHRSPEIMLMNPFHTTDLFLYPLK